jgi:hypothetical protein
VGNGIVGDSKRNLKRHRMIIRRVWWRDDEAAGVITPGDFAIAT